MNDKEQFEKPSNLDKSDDVNVESTSNYELDPSVLSNPLLTETTIECTPLNEIECGKSNEKNWPLLTNSQLKVKIVKTGLSAYGEENSNSLSMHDLYRIDEEKSNIKEVKLEWKNLNYSVLTRKWCRYKSFPWFKYEHAKKVILKNQSGSIRTGELTAIIGPSGAGKSTLLECLSGRRRNNQHGEIYVYLKDETNLGKDHDVKEFEVAFIGQKDHLIGVLTVRESLLFASKLKNYKESNEIKRLVSKASNQKQKGIDYHQQVVKTVMKDLGLESCGDVLVSKCSGGQAKRLSIALELVSKPKILILDEPTSGLDSSSALQCVQLLKTLACSKNNQTATLGIIASIHQPSARVLHEFKNVYVLSCDGRCLYHGSVENLLPHLSRFGLHCPQFHNPADFLIEIATKEQGTECMDELANFERTQQIESQVEEESTQKRHKITSVVDRMTKQNFPTSRHTWLLLRRTWKNTIREPMLTWLRLLQHILVGCVSSYMYNYKIGAPSGCFDELTQAFHFNASSPLTSLEDVQSKFLRQQSVAADNAAFMFFTVLFLCFANSSATVLTFPLEMSVFVKERRNAWYSCGTYFFAKLLADTPFQIIIPIIFSGIVYTATGQLPSWWRFGLFCIICILTASISQSVGILFGIMFLEDLTAAVFMSVLSLTPFFLLGGFFTTYSGVSAVFKPITILSYCRYAFESFMVTIYGFGRCDNGIKQVSSAAKQSSLADIACLFGSRISKDSQMMATIEELRKENVTSELLQTLFTIEESCARKLVEKIDEFKSAFDHDLVDMPEARANVSSLVDDNRFNSSSYMLMHWELGDHILWKNLTILATKVTCKDYVRDLRSHKGSKLLRTAQADL
ncbi:ABC transporter-like protein 12 [Dinothrombium tinctorium]|uniref:ABC transporter-like protein 12 n=1 Tax=Dinothrombium tinctorium TaxID=1965070 RepID=A0A443R8D9_9ACAR|nr:ABC transporter-like protein 12 [Dinothrombium tinctorium]